MKNLTEEGQTVVKFAICQVEIGLHAHDSSVTQVVAIL